MAVKPSRGQASKGKKGQDDAAAPGAGAKPVMAFVLAALLPGLGHAYLGKWGRAAAILVMVAALVGLGLSHDAGLYTPSPGEPLTYLATFGNMGIGPAYFLLRAAGVGTGDADAPTYEYGSTYMLTAGLINLLVMLDAYDVAVGRKP